MQLKHPLREDGPVQQFGHDAVFGAEDGIDGLLGDTRFLEEYLRAVCFSILTVILSGSIALERIELTLFNLFLSNYASNLRERKSLVFSMGA